MNKINGLTNIFIMFFILIVATCVILALLGAIDTGTLTETSLKAGAVLAILAISSFVISWLQSSRK